MLEDTYTEDLAEEMRQRLTPALLRLTLYMSWDPHYWARVDAQKKEK